MESSYMIFLIHRVSKKEATCHTLVTLEDNMLTYQVVWNMDIFCSSAQIIKSSLLKINASTDCLVHTEMMKFLQTTLKL